MTTYTSREMLDLIGLHYAEAYDAGNYHAESPYFLGGEDVQIVFKKGQFDEKTVKATKFQLDGLIRYYHNGPDWVQ